MKKIIIILIFLLCTLNVDAKVYNKIKISNVKYETTTQTRKKQTGTLEFKTTYIYDIEEI